MENLPRSLKKIIWISVTVIIFLLAMFVVRYYSAIEIGREHGIHGIFNILMYWDKIASPDSWNLTYKGYEVLIAERVSKAFLPFGIALLVSVYLYVFSIAQKNHIKLWSLIKTNQTGKRIKLEDHFSKQSITMMKRRVSKKQKWIAVIAVAFATVFLATMSCMNIYLAIDIGQSYGMNGLSDVLAIWYQDVDVDKIYYGYELVIGCRVSTGIMLFKGSFLCLLCGLITFRYNYKDTAFNKCWALVTEKAKANE